MEEGKATEILHRFASTWCEWDVDAFADLYTPDAHSYDDPFEPPLVGHEAIRENMIALSEIEDEVTFEVGQHWYLTPTILAEWAASYTDHDTGERVRFAGFLVFDLASDDRIQTARFWYNRVVLPEPDGERSS